MKRSLFSFLAIMLFSTVSVMGQVYLDNGASFETFYLNFLGGGARAEGMGKAFIGVSDDVNGGSWNPAGIYQIEKTVMGLSFGSQAPRGKTESDLYFEEAPYHFSNDHSGFFGSVSSLNIAAPVRIKGHQFVGSFNYVKNYDEYQQTDLDGPITQLAMVIDPETGYAILDWVISDVNLNSILKGGLYTASFTVGTRLYKNISFGISGNIYTGRTVRDEVIYVLVLSELISNSIDTNKFNGFNFTIGFKLNGEKLNAGLIVRTPFSLNIKGGKSIYNYNALNGLIIDNGTDTTFYDELLNKYEMPLMIGAGLAYNLTENFMLAIDGEYRGYGSTKIKYRDSLVIDPGGDNEEFFTEYDPELSNIFLLHLGGEYMWHKNFGTVPLRFGFGYEPLPAVNYDENGSTSTPVSYNFSVGTGIMWEQIYFDFAYTYTYINQDMAVYNDFYFKMIVAEVSFRNLVA